MGLERADGAQLAITFAFAQIEAGTERDRIAKPTAAIVRVCLGSLRAILANTAGNIAAAPLIQWMQAHHWLFN